VADTGETEEGGVMVARALAPLLPSGYRHASGVVIHEPDQVDAIIGAIERTAEKAGFHPYVMGPLLPQLKPHHWDTYARMAGVETPDLAGWQVLVRRFAEKHGCELPENWP